MYTEAVGVICSIGNLTLLDEYGTYIGNVLYGSLHYATYVLDRYRHQCILRYLDTVYRDMNARVKDCGI